MLLRCSLNIYFISEISADMTIQNREAVRKASTKTVQIHQKWLVAFDKYSSCLLSKLVTLVFLA